MASGLNAVFYSSSYHPIQAGSIDGTDTVAHDNGVYRAVLANSTGLYDPTGDPKAEGNPFCIIFVGRLSQDTTEATLEEIMSKYGRVKNLRIVRHIVTGASQGYAFVEYETEKEMRYAYEAAHHIKIDGSEILVDYNRQILMPGWIPRRLGGGLGGRKESGQLRFGGRDRPFRKPLRPIPHKELEKLGIPLPPEGHYLSRFEIPPLPKRRSDIPIDRLSKYESSQYRDKISQENSYEASERRNIKQEKLKTESISQEDIDRSQYYQQFEPERDPTSNDAEGSLLKEGRKSEEGNNRSRHKSRRLSKSERMMSETGSSETDNQKYRMDKQDVRKERKRYTDHGDDYTVNRTSQKYHHNDQNSPT